MVRADDLTANAPFLAPESRLLPPSRDDITGVTRLPPQSTQRPDFPQVCALAPPSGTGILTGCPSPAPSGLGLGPTNPTRTDLPSETSSFRRTWFSHVSRYSCQHSHFHALQLASQLAFPVRGTLPYQLLPPKGFRNSRASAGDLSPVSFSAPPRSTSELLRTLSRMAASGPTSWLSRHDDLVSHLVTP